MEEKRKLERQSPFYFLRVFDVVNRQLGGRIINMTRDGITLVSEEPININTYLKFRMALPETIPDRKQMTFAAKAIWCEEDKEPGYYRIGCCFDNLSPKNLETINQLCQTSN